VLEDVEEDVEDELVLVEVLLVVRLYIVKLSVPSDHAPIAE